LLEKFTDEEIEEAFFEGFSEIESLDKKVGKIFLNSEDFRILISRKIKSKYFTFEKMKTKGFISEAEIHLIGKNKIIFYGEGYEYTPEIFRNTSRYDWIHKC